MTDRIDVHSHYFPTALVEAFEQRARPPRIYTENGRRLLTYGPGVIYPLAYAASELDAKLAMMDELDISLTILSVNVPGIDWFEADEAPDIARAVNNELAAVVRGSGGRFAALAALPMQVPGGAEAELRRVAGMGLCGAQIYSNVAGGHADDAALRPVFSTAAELNLPIVIHPTYPLSAQSVGGDPLTTTVGFLFDTTTCALRLILDGVFERDPTLKLVLGHSGSLLPQLIGRIDYQFELLTDRHNELGPPSEMIRLLYTDAVCAWPPALRAALDFFGADRVMFGTDDPFWQPQRTIDTVEATDLSAIEDEALRVTNARRVFAL